LPELARKPQAVRQVLPDLLRDLGAPFPFLWERLHDAYGPRDAARRFAKVLEAVETHGTTVVVAAVIRALASDTPLVLTELTPAAVPPVALPAPLREIEVLSGCAADYDGWLTEVPA
jgi:hypothetical protein